MKDNLIILIITLNGIQSRRLQRQGPHRRNRPGHRSAGIDDRLGSRAPPARLAKKTIFWQGGARKTNGGTIEAVARSKLIKMWEKIADGTFENHWKQAILWDFEVYSSVQSESINTRKGIKTENCRLAMLANLAR